MDWIKTGRTVKANGESTVVYTAKGAEWLTIESRKRAIPHANGVGFWMHTSFWVRVNGQDVKQRFSLKDAKAWAERLEFVDRAVHGAPVECGAQCAPLQSADGQ